MTENIATSATMEPSFYVNQGRFKGLFSWIFSVDHKRIGILYLIAILIFFVGGMTLGTIMRIEMIPAAHKMMGAETYNALFTVHGILMIFLFLIPSIPSSFGNFFVPLLIGARDVFFPRLNLLSWWIYMTGGVMMFIALFSGGGAPDTGWTFYIPYSTRTHTNVTLATLAIFLIGFSTILTGINFITTIHRMRAPGMTWFRMPLFIWAIYATSWIQILATPVIAITFVLIVLDRTLGLGLFDPTKGGDPLLYQHLFWIYSHPAVYIMILPGMGIVSEIIPVFARKKIFGYTFIAFSSIAIASIGSLVWGHHMFVSGTSVWSNYIFSFLTFIVAIPSAIKVFNWIATLYKGSIDLRPPLLMTLFFMFLFLPGGLTGMIQAGLGPNLHLHDTYWVVGHFHYIMFGGGGVMFFAGLHYWFPKMFGRMFNETAATIGMCTFFIGFNLFYGTMLFLGLYGMPRRYYDYLPQYTNMHVTASIGAFIMVAGLVTLLVNLLVALFRGVKAPANPWGGLTLEWQTASPPPEENFRTIPVVTAGPYDYPSEMDS